MVPGDTTLVTWRLAEGWGKMPVRVTAGATKVADEGPYSDLAVYRQPGLRVGFRWPAEAAQAEASLRLRGHVHEDRSQRKVQREGLQRGGRAVGCRKFRGNSSAAKADPKTSGLCRSSRRSRDKFRSDPQEKSTTPQSTASGVESNASVAKGVGL